MATSRAPSSRVGGDPRSPQGSQESERQPSSMVFHNVCLFGWTIDAVLHSPHWLSFPQDLDVVEVWCGVGSIVRAARGKGMRAEGFDKKLDEANDITTKGGFLRALTLVMRLRIYGLLWMAPVCASMGFANSSNCKISIANPLGNTEYAPVSAGNLMAQIACFFTVVAYKRNCSVGLENPRGSWLYKLPCSSFRLHHNFPLCLL